MTTTKRNALGRGLGALIDTTGVQPTGSSSLNEIEIDKIKANPDQPRTYFDAEALEELAASICSIGVVQPITLRELPDGSYQIISGERRYRASKLAGLSKIPAYIKAVDDEAVREMALVENIQREDLNAIEIALSYRRLMDESHYTQEQLSDRVGKKRATVANYLRLLSLPAEIQMGLKDKKIDMGHARALAAVIDPAAMLGLYNETLSRAYSVRQVEEQARRLNEAESSQRRSTQETTGADYASLCENLSSLFGTTVRISRKDNGKGYIRFDFSSDEDLENLMATLDKLH